MRQRRAYAAIREAHEETGYPIELACKLLHAARSAYHKWASGKLSQRAAENERLADTLEKIHEESPDKGYRRLNDDLRHDCGIHVNDKTITHWFSKPSTRLRRPIRTRILCSTATEVFSTPTVPSTTSLCRRA